MAQLGMPAMPETQCFFCTARQKLLHTRPLYLPSHPLVLSFEMFRSAEDIIQFLYGEDGMDGLWIEELAASAWRP